MNQENIDKPNLFRTLEDEDYEDNGDEIKL